MPTSTCQHSWQQRLLPLPAVRHTENHCLALRLPQRPQTQRVILPTLRLLAYLTAEQYDYYSCQRNDYLLTPQAWNDYYPCQRNEYPCQQNDCLPDYGTIRLLPLPTERLLAYLTTEQYDYYPCQRNDELLTLPRNNTTTTLANRMAGAVVCDCES